MMPQIAPLGAGEPDRLGPFRVLGRIGEGGQGIVYLGVDAAGERAAIKLLHVKFSGDAVARSRFAREARAAQRVASFCTAGVLAADLEGDTPYIASEYIEGRSLREVVESDGPLRGAPLQRLAIGTATALTAIHHASIVHRDFKPDNVLIAADGPRVVDFGIARILDSTGTITSRAIGTPAYMAPEQIAGADVGPHTDVFAWGATIAFAATGETVFEGGSIAVVLNRILNHEPDLGVLPEPLRGVVGAALAKSPAGRPSADRLLLRLLGHPDAGSASPAILTQGAEVAAPDEPRAGDRRGPGTGPGTDPAARLAARLAADLDDGDATSQLRLPGSGTMPRPGAGAQKGADGGAETGTERGAGGPPPSTGFRAERPHDDRPDRPDRSGGSDRHGAFDGPGRPDTPGMPGGFDGPGRAGRPGREDRYGPDPEARPGRDTRRAPAAQGFSSPLRDTTPLPDPAEWTGHPEHTGPEHTGPEYARPEYARPEYAGPEYAGPEYSGHPGYAGHPGHGAPVSPPSWQGPARTGGPDGHGRSRRGRWIAAALALLLLAGAAAAAVVWWPRSPSGGTPVQPSGEVFTSVVDKAAKTGRLVVGMRDHLPGVALRNGDRWSGFEVDLALEIAEALGVPESGVTFRGTARDERPRLLAAGDVDMVLATYPINEVDDVTFAGPYYLAHVDVLVKDESPIRTVKGLEGSRMCRPDASASVAVLQKAVGRLELLPARTYAECMEMLRDGRVDAVPGDDLLLAGYGDRESVRHRLLGLELTDERYAVALKRGDERTCEAVRGAIAELHRNGTVRRLLDRHFSRVGFPGRENDLPAMAACG
ncbi:protein kinase [Streptosporangium sp. NPDC050855]|uniref:protein kinase domain-containing protein n=1 Tax=Streptosporangium sp. NPDC050855 TaxID=3366194 RepID=UPI0037B73333